MKNSIKLISQGNEKYFLFCATLTLFFQLFQVICSARNMILHLNPCLPGSTHDSRVFKESNLYQEFEQGMFKGHLLGDSAYALDMLTPFDNPNSEAEER